MELLAEPSVSINRITKLCRVSEHTVRAVRDREAVSIAERKQRLTSIYGNVAEIAAERMEDWLGTASLRDAGITAGIATDKLLALSSDPFSQANNHLHVHLEPVNLMEKFNEMVRQLPTKALPKDTHATFFEGIKPAQKESQRLSDNFGHSHCVILRESCKVVELHFPL